MLLYVIVLESSEAMCIQKVLQPSLLYSRDFHGSHGNRDAGQRPLPYIACLFVSPNELGKKSPCELARLTPSTVHASHTNDSFTITASSRQFTITVSQYCTEQA